MQILFILAIVLQLICLPVYLFAPCCRGGKRPLIAKCVCAALFILIGVLAMRAAQNYNAWAYLMLSGLFVSSWGDWFLGVSMKGKVFIAGVLSFLTAHVFYVAAYIKITAAQFPDVALFAGWEIVAALAGLAALIVVALVRKMQFGEFKIPILIYSAVIVTMLVKAVSLGIHLFSAGGDAIPAAVLLSAGAFLFVLSDAVLALILFGGKDTRGMTALNLITYFSAQTLLASSLYFTAFAAA